MAFFVKIKSWQLFILLLGFPVINNILIFHIEPNAFLFRYADLLTKGIILLWTFCYISWLFSIGKLLYQIPKVTERVSFRLFRFNCLFTIAYTTLLMILRSLISITSLNFDSIVGTVMPFHLYSMFAIFYILKSVAKMIQFSQATKQENNFIGTMFRLAFFPVGVWKIQPLINKIYLDLEIQKNRNI